MIRPPPRRKDMNNAQESDFNFQSDRKSRRLSVFMDAGTTPGGAASGSRIVNLSREMQEIVAERQVNDAASASFSDRREGPPDEKNLIPGERVYRD